MPLLPRRRLALWRARIYEGRRLRFYVTLSGEVCTNFRVAAEEAKKDKQFLNLIGVKFQHFARHIPAETNRENEENGEDCNQATNGNQATTLEYYIPRLPGFGDMKQSPQELSFWRLPRSVIQAYAAAGVTSLYTWQTETLHLACQSSSLAAGPSIVYAAPTSGGKSLVAELLAARALLFGGRNVIMVLPYVSLCEEKLKWMRRIYGLDTVGLRIECFYHSKNIAWSPDVDVAICTFEKANAILNRIISSYTLSLFPPTSRLKLCVVVDECHMLGDPQRGFLLEILLAKLQLLRRMQKNITTNDIQIIGLSATLPNLNEIALWLNAEVYCTDVRPLPLDTFLKHDDALIHVTANLTSVVKRLPNPRYIIRSEISSNHRNPTGSRGATFHDSDHVTLLTWQRISRRQQVLIFCATKDWCQNLCKAMTQGLQYLVRGSLACLDASGVIDFAATAAFLSGGDNYETNSEEQRFLLEQLRVVSLTGKVCTILEQSIPLGIAYHHAGLTAEERELVENAYRDGVLLALCATSTLAVGVNLPVARVIFRNCEIGNGLLDATRFKQMAGRAGRKGFDVSGESILICKTPEERTLALRLMEETAAAGGGCEQVLSALNGPRLARLALELLALRLVENIHQIVQVVSTCTLAGHQQRRRLADSAAEKSTLLQQQLLAVLGWLIVNRFITSASAATQTAIEATSYRASFQLASPSVLIELFALTAVDQSNRSAKVLRVAFPQLWRAYKNLPSELVLPELASPEVLDSRTEKFRANCKLQATALGSSVVEAALSPFEAVELFANLTAMQWLGVPLRNSQVLALAVTPVNVSSAAVHTAWVETGALPLSKLIEDRQAQLMQRKAESGIVRELLIQQLPLGTVCQKYATHIGVVQQLQMRAVVTAATQALLAERLGWAPLASLLRAIGTRLEAAYRPSGDSPLHAVELLRGGQRSALLHAAGFSTLQAIAEAGDGAILRALFPQAPEGDRASLQFVKLVKDQVRQHLDELAQAALDI